MEIKTFATVVVLSAATLVVGCGGTNSNANTNANGNRAVALDPANMPPGLSAQPIPSNANIPGITDSAGALPRGNTPIPGIPTEAELKKKAKPGLTPTPGIPDEATIKRMMNQGAANMNVNAQPPGGRDQVKAKPGRTPVPKP